MEEHGLTDAERKLLLGLLNDPEAEAGGADSLVSEAEQAEQQLDELEAQDWDFASKDPAQEVQNPDDGEDSDDVGQWRMHCMEGMHVIHEKDRKLRML